MYFVVRLSSRSQTPTTTTQGLLVGPLVKRLLRFSFWLVLATGPLEATDLFLAGVVFSFAEFRKVRRLWLRSGAVVALSCNFCAAIIDFNVSVLRFFFASHNSCLSTTVRSFFPSSRATIDSALSNGLPPLLFHSSLAEDGAVRVVSKTNDKGASSELLAACVLYMY
jgi:hypothetical protein